MAKKKKDKQRSTKHYTGKINDRGVSSDAPEGKTVSVAHVALSCSLVPNPMIIYEWGKSWLLLRQSEHRARHL